MGLECMDAVRCRGLVFSRKGVPVRQEPEHGVLGSSRLLVAKTFKLAQRSREAREKLGSVNAAISAEDFVAR